MKPPKPARRRSLSSGHHSLTKLISEAIFQGPSAEGPSIRRTGTFFGDLFGSPPPPHALCDADKDLLRDLFGLPPLSQEGTDRQQKPLIHTTPQATNSVTLGTTGRQKAGVSTLLTGPSRLTSGPPHPRATPVVIQTDVGRLDQTNESDTPPLTEIGMDVSISSDLDELTGQVISADDSQSRSLELADQVRWSSLIDGDISLLGTRALPSWQPKKCSFR